MTMALSKPQKQLAIIGFAIAVLVVISRFIYNLFSGGQ